MCVLFSKRITFNANGVCRTEKKWYVQFKINVLHTLLKQKISISIWQSHKSDVVSCVNPIRVVSKAIIQSVEIVRRKVYKSRYSINKQ